MVGSGAGIELRLGYRESVKVRSPRDHRCDPGLAPTELRLVSLLRGSGSGMGRGRA